MIHRNFMKSAMPTLASYKSFDLVNSCCICLWKFVFSRVSEQTVDWYHIYGWWSLHACQEGASFRHDILGMKYWKKEFETGYCYILFSRMSLHSMNNNVYLLLSTCNDIVKMKLDEVNLLLSLLSISLPKNHWWCSINKKQSLIKKISVLVASSQSLASARKAKVIYHKQYLMNKWSITRMGET